MTMRSKYIYLIYRYTYLISVHTVKREAIEWLKESEWEESEVTFYRMLDGGTQGKDEKKVKVPWSEL
jgi:hypothetical protein